MVVGFLGQCGVTTKDLGSDQEDRHGCRFLGQCVLTTKDLRSDQEDRHGCRFFWTVWIN